MIMQSFHDVAEMILARQIELTATMLDLLSTEKDMLQTNNINLLDNLSSQKQPIVAELESLNQNWLSLLENADVELSVERITQFLVSYDEKHKTQLQSLWGTLQQQARECQRKNTVNGSIIALRQQATQQTLAILRGQSLDDKLYDPYGNQSSANVSHKTLAKA